MGIQTETANFASIIKAAVSNSFNRRQIYMSLNTEFHVLKIPHYVHSFLSWLTLENTTVSHGILVQEKVAWPASEFCTNTITILLFIRYIVQHSMYTFRTWTHTHTHTHTYTHTYTRTYTQTHTDVRHVQICYDSASQFA